MKRTSVEEDLEWLISRLDEIPGWATEEKVTKLFELVQKNQPKRIVEIGVYGGRSLAALTLSARNLPHHCEVVGIDAWNNAAAMENMFPDVNPEEQDHLDYWEGVDLELIRDKCFDFFHETSLDSHVNIINADSVSTATLFDKIDILHIDANHSDWSATRDVCNWIPNVISGGFVVMDDTNWKTVAETAIPMVEKRCDLVESMGENDDYRIYQKVR